MSLQRRIVLYLMIAAPLVWLAALVITINRAGLEVNELYDTTTIRLALQVQATLPDSAAELGSHRVPEARTGTGQADLHDLATAVWDSTGQLRIADREGVTLPYLRDAVGFVDQELQGQPWRTYYLQSSNGQWLVAAAQRVNERNDLVYALTVSQLVPWLLVLPILLVVMALAIRQGLSPLRQLSAALGERAASDLSPVQQERAPAELKPLVSAMNGLFVRMDALLTKERRFTADAAHELRTPLAALSAQWDVVQHASGDVERRIAEQRHAAGLARMDRLITQLLAMSQVDTTRQLPMVSDIDWRSITEIAFGDCTLLAERRQIELVCEWPPQQADAMPLRGDPALIGVLVRNLLDNATRYAPPGSAVVMRIGAASIEVENRGPVLSESDFAAFGTRFSRRAGQRETGSGLGISIAQRIAQLHGLLLSFGPGADGSGVRAVLRPA
ncbi:quorum sensing histidine kinase QseC [soil metagenome]